MDVGDPSNFVRILEIFHHEFASLKKVITSYSITDEETRSTIRDVYRKYHYLPDPHGAVGFLALERFLSEHPGEKGIFLETAHPVKFYDAVEEETGEKVPLPGTVKDLLGRGKNKTKITTDFGQLKEFLLTLKVK
jgi:threonine synthase